MADSFFGFDTSSSNLNDVDCGVEPSEEEYDALNNETFGHDDDLDWEVEHEQLANQLESSRRQNAMDEADSRLEASLSQLVLDDSDVQPRTSLGSSVWSNDFFPTPPAPVAPPLKNVCTVEELERQLRQNQPPQNYNQNYFQPRFPPVILQRPPGLQAPVSLPFAPQQPIGHNLNQMNKSVGQNLTNNQLINHAPQNMNLGQSQMNQFMQNNHYPNIGQGMINQMPQNINQMGQNTNQMGQNTNQMGQMHQMNQNHLFPTLNQNQIPQNFNQMGPNMNPMGPNMNQMGTNQMSQNVNQMAPNINQKMQMSQNVNQMGQNMNQMGQNMNQIGQNVNHINQMGQNLNQMGQNMNQMMPNGNFSGNYHNLMGNPRMMGPPPGMGMQRPNFNSNSNQFNQNFRAPPPKSEPINNQKNQTQSPKKRPEPKIKSQVYNNSQKLTSQNLVQMIQNTHPMLMYNSFHNASHHPMLGRNFNNIVHPLLGGQRNGGFNLSQDSTSEDGSTSSDFDEYAGLMTQREKQWLINIQMLQLNTGTPYIHDFYYTVFLERQANKEKAGVKEAHKANQQNHPFYSGGVKQEDRHRERHNSHRHNSTSEDQTRTYVPLQFENSLGKLQCGSVTAPRKIIDLEVVGSEPAGSRLSRAPSVASTTHPSELQIPREMKRTKQLLLDIEALYIILLRLEELNDPLAISNALILKEREEKQKQQEAAQKEAEVQEDETNVFLKNIESVQRRPKQESPKSECVDKRQVVNLAINQKPVPVKNLLDEDKDELLSKMFTGLLYGDRLAQMLTVRKGRTLVTRFLTRIPATHSRLRFLWCRILRALPSTRCRFDARVADLSDHYRKYIQNSSGWTAVLECCGIIAEALDPARTPYALTNPITLSCVCALAEKAMVLSYTPEATSSERQWFKFLKTVARALKNTTLNVSKPVSPLSETKLLHHIKQLESRSIIEILQRGKRASDFADLTKNDVSEYLTRYLC